MQTTDTTQSRAPEPVENKWNFIEAWVDPLQFPPYILLLLSDESGSCCILDPSKGYAEIKSSQNYHEAQLWLLEDEYEPLEGKLTSDECV